ncbi:hypothetical protein JDV02_003320 [Purpureocillium takamizusanense]|uniref:Uncharacterized protein n=1 Tax=Purpureocillium takamizusanense TaxID=2060973 RepID=A0A9Q8V8Q8_9HYPO|nr:uncharacterized protein JDV02_003320 [Purpureocillium takamizusanense]UNI16938.1 hypothetical protein JDV02_003320 [Purpureocillium takamizusanense]
MSAKDLVAQELHAVVGMMMDAIGSREAEAFAVAKTYQEKTMGCVEVIESRQVREREIACLRAEEDASLFHKLIEDARTMIKVKRQTREGILQDLENTVTKRKALVDRSTSQLDNLGQSDTDAGQAP